MYNLCKKCSLVDSEEEKYSPSRILVSSALHQSLLQQQGQQHALAAAGMEESQLLGDTVSSTDEIECVICLDTFSEENPMIPTLCACGESKSFFHYQCLYAWLEKSSKCPTCGASLYFQEKG